MVTVSNRCVNYIARFNSCGNIGKNLCMLRHAYDVKFDTNVNCMINLCRTVNNDVNTNVIRELCMVRDNEMYIDIYEENPSWITDLINNLCTN